MQVDVCKWMFASSKLRGAQRNSCAVELCALVQSHLCIRSRGGVCAGIVCLCLLGVD